MEESELLSLLRLSSVAGIGSVRIRKLVSHFGKPSVVFSASLSDLLGIAGIDKTIARKILNNNGLEFAENQLKRCQKAKVQIITYYDQNYPPILKQISTPPIILFVKGEIVDQDQIALGIVGTRRPTSYGKKVTEWLSKELGRRGFTIVSGLARGVDTIAHTACVRSGFRTFAVLGSGIDVIYPIENKRLAAQICENGALLTELPCGSKPDAVNFPKRNRIISGISLGVLVVEAGEKSGALITASMALQQNREVFAVPGEIFRLQSKGTNRLIQEGAKLVANVDDILEELDCRLRHLMPAKSVHPTAQDLPELSEKEKRILEVLSSTPVHIDYISEHTGFSTAETLSLLLTLELKEVIRQHSGKLFSLY